MARRIRLTEDGLRRMIGECVGEMVNEGLFDRITAELKSADEAENPCYLGDEDMPDFKGGLKRAWNGAKDFVKRGYERMTDDLQAAAEVENPLYCDEGLLRLRGMIHEAVNDVLREGREGYFVADDGDGLYNVFSYDDFDEDGYYMGHEGEEGYHIDDFDIVYESDDFDDACLWAETAMP